MASKNQIRFRNTKDSRKFQGLIEEAGFQAEISGCSVLVSADVPDQVIGHAIMLLWPVKR